MTGRCAKRHVTATLVHPNGDVFIGSNWCGNAQSECPRLPGEGYDKCKSICQQTCHAEVDVIAKAGTRARGATIYVSHHYGCQSCQDAAAEAGVKALVFTAPVDSERTTLS